MGRSLVTPALDKQGYGLAWVPGQNNLSHRGVFICTVEDTVAHLEKVLGVAMGTQESGLRAVLS